MAEKSSWGGEDSQQGGGWRTRVGEVAAGGLGGPTGGMDKPGGTTGERDRPHKPGFQYQEMEPQNL